MARNQLAMCPLGAVGRRGPPAGQHQLQELSFTFGVQAPGRVSLLAGLRGGEWAVRAQPELAIRASLVPRTVQLAARSARSRIVGICPGCSTSRSALAIASNGLPPGRNDAVTQPARRKAGISPAVTTEDLPTPDGPATTTRALCHHLAQSLDLVLPTHEQTRSASSAVNANSPRYGHAGMVRSPSTSGHVSDKQGYRYCVGVASVFVPAGDREHSQDGVASLVNHDSRRAAVTGLSPDGRLAVGIQLEEPATDSAAQLKR